MQSTHRPKLSSSASHPPSSPPVSYSLSRSISPPPRQTRSPPMSPTPPTKSSTHRPGHGRRPSLTSWLSRTSSNGSHVVHYAPSKPVKISEPKVSGELNLLGNYPRSGALGNGALVVRTPQEALAGSGVTPDYESGPEEDVIEEDEESESEEMHPSQGYVAVNGPLATAPTRPRRNSISSPPESPPLPPIPISKSTSALHTMEEDLPPRTRASPPNRPPPPVPASPAAASSLSVATAPVAASAASLTTDIPLARPALKQSSSSSPTLSAFPPVPPLPAHLASPYPPPPFSAILLSPVPSHAIDKSKVIVTLETCTATHRTTLTTLLSRPSHLATYLASLFRSPNPNSHFRMRRESDAHSESQYSADGEEMEMEMEEEDGGDTAFNSLFHNHLTASGLLPHSSYNIHIFLDRPSVTYDHILTYLRTPTSTPEVSPSLPHAVQLHTYSTARVELLVALRDEARYLGLDELHRLCVDELRARQPQTASHAAHHVRGFSNTSILSSRSGNRNSREAASSPTPGAMEAVAISVVNSTSSTGSAVSSSMVQAAGARDSVGSGTGSGRGHSFNGSPLTSPNPSRTDLQKRLASKERGGQGHHHTAAQATSGNATVRGRPGAMGNRL